MCYESEITSQSYTLRPPSFSSMTADTHLCATARATVDLLRDDVVVMAILTSDADRVHERLAAAHAALDAAEAYEKRRRSLSLFAGSRRALSRAFGHTEAK